MRNESKVSAGEAREGTRRGTGSEIVRKTPGAKGGGISESDSLSEDRINRVHEVSEEVTWLLSRENNSLSSFVSFSRVFVPFLLLFPRACTWPEPG